MLNVDYRIVGEVPVGIIEAANEVYKTLGPGYSETVYRKSLAIELRLRGFANVQEESPCVVKYKGVTVGYRLTDIQIGLPNPCILELKAVSGENFKLWKNQLSSYLLLTGVNCGIIINFKNS